MGQGGLGGLIPSGGGSADGFYDFLRAAGVLTPRPHIRIPGAPDGAMPDVPRLPEPEVPRAPEPDAPRVDDPAAPRAEETDAPWYRDPRTLATGAAWIGMSSLPFLIGSSNDGFRDSAPGDLTDVGDTAAMKAQQKPLGSEEFRARQAAFRAKEDEKRAWLNHRNRIAGGAQNIIGGPNGNAAFWNNMADLSDEERAKVMVSMMPMDRNRALVEAQNAEKAGEMARTAVSRFMERNGGPLAGVQAEAAAEQLRAEREKNRSDDEDILANKYAESYYLPWWLGGGYDEFTVAEQQLMFDDLIDQGYKPAEAQRAVDRQAHKRRASQHADWNAGPR